MIIHKGYSNLDLRNPVATLGVFDGVHMGHKFLIARLVRAARESNADSVVITFNPHPKQVLGASEPGPLLLTTYDEKVRLLRETGIGHLIVLDFNREFSNTPACDFVKEVLLGKLGVRHLILGHDHRFGNNGEGTYETIKNCEGAGGIITEKAEVLFSGDVQVSSTAIREALLSGRLDEACSMLGYNYSLTGNVVAGKKLGRLIGFPTANIQPSDDLKLVPSSGVYAVEVHMGSSRLMGMLSIGSNPTVNDNDALRSIEVHIIDFSKEIYGSEITLVFRKRLRDERKFPDTDSLARQMEVDKLESIRLLS